MTLPLDRTQRITYLNDLLRTHAGDPEAPASWVNGRVLITAGIAAMDIADQAAILLKVNTFDAFNADNDPHGEHDFGAFDYHGQRIFWKIDYYDPNLTTGSEDPADPGRTARVLTIILAEEY